jgi:hypothetical protein
MYSYVCDTVHALDPVLLLCVPPTIAAQVCVVQ